jgi:hypothetical protein
MGKESECKRDQEEDADCECLVTEHILDSLDAVLGGRADLDLLEIEEKPWIANTVTV